MQSSAIPRFVFGRLYRSLLIAGVQAIPNRVNRADTSSRRLPYDTRSAQSGADMIELDSSMLASEPILYHEKTVFLTPPIVITLILFLVFSAGLIGVFFYGQEIRSFFQGLGRRETKQRATEEPRVDFGFDVPTEAEVEARKWRGDKKTVERPFWRHCRGLSASKMNEAPTLSPEQPLLPPISLDDEKINLEPLKVDKTPGINNEVQDTTTEKLEDPSRCESSRHSEIHVVNR